jgi:hypothetical protein
MQAHQTSNLTHVIMCSLAPHPNINKHNMQPLLVLQSNCLWEFYYRSTILIQAHQTYFCNVNMKHAVVSLLKFWTVRACKHGIQNLTSKIRGFHRNAGKDSSLQGYSAIFMMFRSSLLLPYSVEILKFSIKCSSHLKTLRQKDNNMQVQYCKSTNIMCHCKEFCSLRDLAPSIVYLWSSGYLHRVISQKTGIFKIPLIFNLGIGLR